jgi:hypothetical protein
LVPADYGSGAIRRRALLPGHDALGEIVRLHTKKAAESAALCVKFRFPQIRGADFATNARNASPP